MVIHERAAGMVGSWEKMTWRDGKLEARSGRSAACDVCWAGSTPDVGKSVMDGKAGRGRQALQGRKKNPSFSGRKTHHFHSTLQTGGRDGE